MTDPLSLFVRESNWIEGIRRDPTPAEIEAHKILLTMQSVGVGEMCGFVRIIQPDAVLRDRPGLNVRVGNHVPPRGGPEIRERLAQLLCHLKSDFPNPYDIHRRYENLHPFTDGNGRSGRALWLRMMGGPEKAPLGFLHHWYYQSLSAGDRT